MGCWQAFLRKVTGYSRAHSDSDQIPAAAGTWPKMVGEALLGATGLDCSVPSPAFFCGFDPTALPAVFLVACRACQARC